MEELKALLQHIIEHGIRDNPYTDIGVVRGLRYLAARQGRRSCLEVDLRPCVGTKRFLADTDIVNPDGSVTE